MTILQMFHLFVKKVTLKKRICNISIFQTIVVFFSCPRVLFRLSVLTDHSDKNYSKCTKTGKKGSDFFLFFIK